MRGTLSRPNTPRGPLWWDNNNMVVTFGITEVGTTKTYSLLALMGKLKSFLVSIRRVDVDEVVVV